MVRFVLYADRDEDIGELSGMLQSATRRRGEWALVQSFTGTEALPHFLHFVESNPYLIMVVASFGERGREIAARIRKNNAEARMLWFSGEENSLFSYQVHVNCFGLLPASMETIETALDSCGIFAVNT
ncbi:MAG: hypothetical protein LUF92_04930 [Clostridiales bacterium]|nr:hypothetical protein [Clostridiales bacterium]